MTITSYDFTVSQKEFLSLLEFNQLQYSIIVKKTEDLSLFGKRIEASLTVYTEEFDRPLVLDITIRFTSNGPELRG